MQIKEPTVGRVVKVHKGWFDPPGMVVITAVHPLEASFRHLDTGKTGRLFTVHLYSDLECEKKTVELRRERAEKIGHNPRRR